MASLVLTQSSGTNRKLTGAPQVKQHLQEFTQRKSLAVR
jgi:hypothetical protein